MRTYTHVHIQMLAHVLIVHFVVYFVGSLADALKLLCVRVSGFSTGSSCTAAQSVPLAILALLYFGLRHGERLLFEKLLVFFQDLHEEYCMVSNFGGRKLLQIGDLKHITQTIFMDDR